MPTNAVSLTLQHRYHAGDCCIVVVTCSARCWRNVTASFPSLDRYRSHRCTQGLQVFDDQSRMCWPYPNPAGCHAAWAGTLKQKPGPFCDNFIWYDTNRCAIETVHGVVSVWVWVLGAYVLHACTCGHVGVGCVCILRLCVYPLHTFVQWYIVACVNALRLRALMRDLYTYVVGVCWHKCVRCVCTLHVCADV